MWTTFPDKSHRYVIAIYERVHYHNAIAISIEALDAPRLLLEQFNSISYLPIDDAAFVSSHNEDFIYDITSDTLLYLFLLFFSSGMKRDTSTIII